MTDIVERLRQDAEAGPNGIGFDALSDLEREAADEIERLRGAYEQERKDCINLTEKVIPNLRAEIERLREGNEALKIRIGTYYAGNASGGIVKRLEGEIERLRAHIAEIEAWREKGQKLFDNYATGLGAMFGLGKWWGERPWKQAPLCASCGKHKDHCDGC
jgi:septation ring formation regulator EzrA